MPLINFQMSHKGSQFRLPHTAILTHKTGAVCKPPSACVKTGNRPGWCRIVDSQQLASGSRLLSNRDSLRASRRQFYQR
jgi:hypothetical protein